MRLLLLLLTAFILPPSALASLLEASITGRLSNDRGTFFADLPPQTPFALRVQFDTEAADWNPDPYVGDYFSTASLTLDFGGYHFTTDETRVTVIFDPTDRNCQFLFWSGEEFSQNGFDFAEYGIYVQFNTRGMGLVSNDSLSGVREYDIADLRSTERGYVIDDQYNLGAGNRLLSDEFDGIDSFTIREVPEPGATALVMIGALMLKGGRRKAEGGSRHHPCEAPIRFRLHPSSFLLP